MPAKKNTTTGVRRTKKIETLRSEIAETEARLARLRDELKAMPRTVTIDGVVYAGPMVAHPTNGTTYYVPDIYTETPDEMCDSYEWMGDNADRRHFNTGLVFDSRGKALAVAQAIRRLLTA